jgi:polysaccharide deacetylase family protein (PEP-CTERM system associated)
VRRAKALLENASGAQVFGYRAPSYSVTPKSLWALDILISEGYRYDSSIFPIRHDRYGIPLSPRHAYRLQRPGGSIVEAPASTTRFGPMNMPIAGGGYFRILPYGWTRWGIGRVNRLEGRPAIFYLHPWEIDPEQPRLKAGSLSRFRHYRNLAQTEARLIQLLTDFRFGPMSVVLQAALAAPFEPRPAWALPYLW